jgi:hypothetical protein
MGMCPMDRKVPAAKLWTLLTVLETQNDDFLENGHNDFG